MKTFTYLSNREKFINEINVKDPIFPSAALFVEELSNSIRKGSVCNFDDKIYGYLTDAYVVSDHDNGPVSKTIVFEIKPTMVTDRYQKEENRFTFAIDLEKYTLTGPGNSANNKYEFTGISDDSNPRYITILFRYGK